MENCLQVFKNDEFGEIRTVTIDSEPWFVGKDVATALGYSNTKDALRSHVAEEDKRIVQRSEIATIENHLPKDVFPVNFVSGDIPNRGLTIINESGLYALIFGSKLETAKRFKHWVTSEVLPAIRKNGGYIFGQEKMTDDELLEQAVLVAQRKIAERDKIIAQQRKQITDQRPLVDFATQVTQTKDTIDMDEMAKIAKDEHINIGRNRLIGWLKRKKILRENNTPYQTYIDRGYFNVIEVTKDTSYGSLVFPKTLITGKGQIWIIEKLRAEYV